MPTTRPTSLHRWLADTACRHGDRPAVVAGTQRITISDLWSRAGAVAGALLAIGVRRGDRVALVCDKSIDGITALFGALTSGAICVPVAPRCPRARLEVLLDQCDARAVISCDDVDHAPVIADRRSSRSMQWLEALGWVAELAEGSEIESADPALILYTSGSTGVPKGVTVSHGAIAAFGSWAAEAFGIGPGDRILCPAPLAFDLSTLDVFNIALSGSASVTVPEPAVWMPRFLLQAAREQGVTIWYSVPSILSRLLEEAGLEQQPLLGLRTLLFAGEVMPPTTAARLRRSHPHVDLCNLYGPTETNVVTWYRLPAEIDPTQPIPIGGPCPYARVRLEPLATIEPRRGATGELSVSADTLMTGYWGLPDETARATTEVEESGGIVRYYRTGDRVMIGADGVLHFLGRMDRQVKRHGIRIELGEIEAVLGASPQVSAAAVTAQEERGVVIIRAFVELQPGEAENTMALRAHCAQILPFDTLPDEFVVLKMMPRGSRGKIDYQALARIGARGA